MTPLTNGRPAPVETILVATDFSDGARAALEAAIAIAVAHGARIELLHAVDGPAPLNSKERDAIRDGLHTLEAHVRAAGVAATSRLDIGPPWEAVVRAEDAVDADLLVIGRRGHNPWAHAFLGSKADRIIRVARTPVLAISEHASGAPWKLEKIIVGVDFSEESIHAAAAAGRLAARSPKPVQLFLLHALHAPADYSIGDAGGIVIDTGETESEARARLGVLAEKLRRDGMTVEAITVYDYPVAAIEGKAKAHDVDLVAVGTRGRSGLRHLFLGSIAERVLHHTTCPVLVVRHPKHVDPARQGAADDTAATSPLTPTTRT